MKKQPDIILNSLKKLEKWVEDHDYKGYDPADGLTSFLRPLTFGNLLLDRILQQLVWRFPVNIRPLVGVKPLDSCIGRGYMAWGYLTMLKATGDENYLKKADLCFDWLMENRSPGFDEYCWGKMFDFASRGGRQGKYKPITVWTTLIGMAFLEGYEITGNRTHLTVAQSVCDWILKLPRNITKSGSCINYTPYDNGQCTIHNQSMLAGAMLAKTAQYVDNPKYVKVAKKAMTYTCSRQLPDGSWLYGEEPKYHWIDNFHTGYNLDALKCYTDTTGDLKFENHIKKGFDFYKNNFFEESGRPKYYHNRTFPFDSQCASQSIETLANFSDFDESAFPLAIKVANWTIENMQDKTGYFYFMQYPIWTLKVPMIHWAQATTYKALTFFFDKLNFGKNRKIK